MIINTNLASLNTVRQLGINEKATQSSLAKLSSGLKINTAADDAAGLAISEKMRGQISGLNKASSNAQDGISMLATGEGALNETTSILQRMRELAVQAGNDTNTTTDRAAMQTETNQLTSEVNRIGNTSQFNNQNLLNATGGTTTAGVAAIAGSAGTYTITLPAVATVGDKITIDGKQFTAAAATDTATGAFDQTSAANQANGLAACINADATLSAKYTASVSGTDVQLVQKAGNFSSTAPTDVATGTIVASATTITTAGVTTVAAIDAKSSFTLQIGANENQTMTLDFGDARSAALGITGTGAGFSTTANVTDGTNNTLVENALDLSTSATAGTAVTTIQSAIDKVSAERSQLGAYQNRLDHTINNLGTSSQNITTAEANIRDVDMAKEMTNFQKSNILQQAAQAMLAQANQQGQGVLQLLR